MSWFGTNRHFDTTKNKLPDNWTNNNATRYYNREFWKKCKGELGVLSRAKESADKWQPTINEPNKWSCEGKCGGSHGHGSHGHGSHDHGSHGCGCKGNARCDRCRDVVVVYRTVSPNVDCDNIVELRLPEGGSKAKYLAGNFSPEFVHDSRYQCATVPAYDLYRGNQIDNRREFEFTLSSQSALTKRGVANAVLAQRMIDQGQLQADTYGFSVPMNAINKSPYYYLGDGNNYGGELTGLLATDRMTGYFR